MSLSMFSEKFLRNESPNSGCRPHYSVFDLQQEELMRDNGKRVSIFLMAFDL